MASHMRDQVVVITGASSGIGRATALAFAREGATVVLAARRETPLREVASACERFGSPALALATDVSDESAVKRLVDVTLEAFGRIDVWVNNAAVTFFGRFEDTPSEVFRRVLEINLFGYVHGARAVLPVFGEQGRGVLINVSSQAGKFGQPFTSAYVTSKFAIVGLSECLRQEAGRNIHVCTVLPASIDTPIFQHAGNITGKAVKPIEPVIDVERVAQAIVGCARRPRREIVVGRTGATIAMAHKVAPGVVEQQMRRKVHKDHLQQRSAAPTMGNLFQPMPQWTSAQGGWRVPPSDRSAWPSAGKWLAIAVPLWLGWRALSHRAR